MSKATYSADQGQGTPGFLAALMSGIVTLMLGLAIGVLLLQIYSQRVSSDDLAPVVELQPLLAADGAKGSVMTDAGLAVYADGRGHGQARLRLPAQSSSYPFLQLTLPQPSQLEAMALHTVTAGSAPRLLFGLQTPREKNVMFLWGSGAWQGNAQELQLDLKMQPGSRLLLESIQLRQLSPLVALRHMVWSAWQRNPWSQSSPNFYRSRSASPFFLEPVLVASAIFLFGWATMTLLSRCLNWLPSATTGAVVALLVLWIVLDLRWQRELLGNAQQTKTQYWGKDERQKQLAGPEKGLILAAEEIRRVLASAAEPRVFVSSSIEFLGMRMAYYLLPYNVFWERDEPLRGPGYFQQGDYIVLLQPSEMRMDVASSELLFPNNETLPVTPLFGGGSVALFQVQ